MLMRVGILGGSFDPPHLGHILAARQVIEIMGLDEVWFMPYFAHSWDLTVSSPSHRLAMTELIEEDKVIVSDEEIRFRKKSYTIDTVRRLKSKYPHDFFWIVGSDILSDFYRWKESEALTHEVKFLVVKRNGYPIPTKLPNGFSLVSSSFFATSNISSTIIRSRIAKKLSVEGLTPKSVLTYIRKHKLYEAR